MERNLKYRSQKFALDCWRLCSHIPKSREYNAYVSQFIRCSGSVGANFRASQRAKSTADFINKLKIVEEEIDESMYWIEIFLEILENHQGELKKLHNEANELIAIIVASIKTARKNNNADQKF